MTAADLRHIYGLAVARPDDLTLDHVGAFVSGLPHLTAKQLREVASSMGTKIGAERVKLAQRLGERVAAAVKAAKGGNKPGDGVPPVDAPKVSESASSRPVAGEVDSEPAKPFSADWYEKLHEKTREAREEIRAKTPPKQDAGKSPEPTPDEYDRRFEAIDAKHDATKTAATKPASPPADDPDDVFADNPPMNPADINHGSGGVAHLKNLVNLLQTNKPLPEHVLSKATDAVTAATGHDPKANDHLAKVNAWIHGQAAKHAGRVASHFGIPQHQAHRMLVNAMRQIAAHAVKTGAKSVSGKLGHGGKTLSFNAGAKPAAPTEPSGTRPVAKPVVRPGIPVRQSAARRAAKWIGGKADKLDDLIRRTPLIGDGVPRPKNKSGAGSLPPRQRKAFDPVDELERRALDQDDAAIPSTLLKSWSESDHPRDDHGHWIPKVELEEGQRDPAVAADLRARVSDPEQRAKLDAAIGGKPHAKGKPTAAVDVDGTLATYHGWEGNEHFGKPRPGAKKFLEELAATHRILVFTTRTKADDPNLQRGGASADDLADLVGNWFDEHDLPYDEIYTGQGKPAADVYLDDRAVSVPENPGPDDYDDALDAVREREATVHKASKPDTAPVAYAKIDLTGDLKRAVLSLAARIDKGDLIEKEVSPHVTCHWGFPASVKVADVRAVLSGVE